MKNSQSSCCGIVPQKSQGKRAYSAMSSPEQEMVDTPSGMSADVNSNASSVPPVTENGSLILTPDRNAPSIVITNLRNHFGEQFFASYDRKKLLPPNADDPNSVPEPDVSLAQYGVLLELSDQTIADLIICSRRDANQDLRLDQSYYQDTIHKQRKQYQDEEKRKEAMNNVILQTEAYLSSLQNLTTLPPEEIQEAREAHLEALSAILGVHLDHIYRYDIDPEPEYWIQMDGCRPIKIGNILGIIECKRFGATVMTMTGKIIPDFKKDERMKIVKMMFQCAETAPGDEEGQYEHQIRKLLTAYLLFSKVYDDKDEALTETKLAPFRDENGHVYIVLDHFRRWVRKHQDNFEQKQRFVPVLGNIGCKHSVVRYTSTITGKEMQRNVWQVPMDIYLPNALDDPRSPISSSPFDVVPTKVSHSRD
jgi:hypothetical protein